MYSLQWYSLAALAIVLVIVLSFRGKVKTKLVLIGLRLRRAASSSRTLAYVMGWSPGKPGNYGELVAPRAVSAAPFAALRGKWVLVSVGRGRLRRRTARRSSTSCARCVARRARTWSASSGCGW